MIRYTICRSEASLFWNNFEIPKKSVVASFVGNFSPVKRRRATLVRSVRHLRGEMGEELNNRAGALLAAFVDLLRALLTFLENRGSIYLQKRLIGVLILLAVIHNAFVLSSAGCF